MSDKLRVVVLTTFTINYETIAQWAERHGHEIALVVTLPNQRTPDLTTVVPPQTSVLTTADLTGIAVAAISAVSPDLLICAGFGRLIPAGILALPKYGAVNAHPTALPAGRGPNPMRLLYDGADSLGGTLHRLDATFDTGPILSRRERPLPSPLNGRTVLAALRGLFAEVIEEGSARAIAGEPGEPQDDSQATYAAQFTPAERILDLTEPAAVIRRRAAALTVLGTASARLPGTESEVLIREVEILPTSSPAAPGALLSSDATSWTVQTADHPVRLHRADL